METALPATAFTPRITTIQVAEANGLRLAVTALQTDPWQGTLPVAGPMGPTQPNGSVHQRLHLSGSKRN